MEYRDDETGNDLGGHVPHGGRSDLEPAAPPQLSHDAPTPGPWHVEKIALGECIIAANGLDEIALVYTNDGLDEPTWFPAEANARLMAAAPELYSIVREIARSIECCPICGCWPHTSMCHLVAAIAKAEGR